MNIEGRTTTSTLASEPGIAFATIATGCREITHSELA
jgi:hypothetical protein